MSLQINHPYYTSDEAFTDELDPIIPLSSTPSTLPSKEQDIENTTLNCAQVSDGALCISCSIQRTCHTRELTVDSSSWDRIKHRFGKLQDYVLVNHPKLYHIIDETW